MPPTAFFSFRLMTYTSERPYFPVRYATYSPDGESSKPPTSSKRVKSSMGSTVVLCLVVLFGASAAMAETLTIELRPTAIIFFITTPLLAAAFRILARPYRTRRNDGGARSLYGPSPFVKPRCLQCSLSRAPHLCGCIEFAQAVERPNTGARRLGALDGHVLEEKISMRFMLVKLFWCEDDGKNGHVSLELHVHQSIDHGLCDKFVSINSAVHDKPTRNDGAI